MDTLDESSQLSFNDNIIKPTSDKRLYRGVQLTNGLKVILISDPNTDKSAASLDVNVGSLYDPVNVPGIAHFLEHMLFLGTEKYPEDNAYFKFISGHGGNANAYTSPTNTNFYFDVSPLHLEGALDRFSQFFLSPLLNESSTERELNIVNSEHEKNLKSDSHRINQVNKETSIKDHDFSKFSTGNRDTLKTIPEENGVNVRQVLLDFHSKWYSSNIMSLAVLGKESLDELYEMVSNKFSLIENKNTQLKHYDQGPYSAEQLKKKLTIVPIKEMRKLNLSFPFPDMLEHYKSKPGSYLSHLIGHEGNGSLLAELKKLGLVNTLCAGYYRYADGFGFFDISMDLTESGLNEINEIVTIIFQYINMVNKEGPSKSVHDEFRALSELHFRFKEKSSPVYSVLNVASDLQAYPINDVLTGPYLIEEFKPELVKDLLQYLTPDNMRISISANKFSGKTNMKEKWYQVDYSIDDIEEECLNKWRSPGLNENLYMPEKNEFLPENLDLVKRETTINETPILIKNTKTIRAWFQQDNEYLLPKAFYGFEFNSPLTLIDPLFRTATTLFISLINDSLNQYTYSAELAGIAHQFQKRNNGFSLEVSGYNDKLPTLIYKVFDELTKFQFKRERFDILKECLYRDLRNYETQPIRSLLQLTMQRLLIEFNWHFSDLIATEKYLTYEKMNELMKIILSNSYIEILAHGNIEQNQTLNIINTIEEKLNCNLNRCETTANNCVQNREFCLDKQTNYIYNEINNIHEDNGVTIYYQIGMQSMIDNGKLSLLNQMIAEPCFNHLRTTEQLGYIVSSSVRRVCGVQGLLILVQSQYDTEFLDERIEAFLVWAKDYIMNMNEEDFEKEKQAVIVKLLEKPKKLLSLSNLYWNEILSKHYNFNRKELEVSEIRKLTKEDMITFFQKYIDSNAPHRRKLSTRIQSFKHAKKSDQAQIDNEQKQNVIIDNVNEFKRNLMLYPATKPFILIKNPDD